jgi:hypothetical protein
MNTSINVEYTIMAKGKDGKSYRRKGITGGTSEFGELRTGLADLYFYALDDLVLNVFEKNELKLGELAHLTVRFENIEID